MVDLTLFHPQSGKKYATMDSLNRRTGRLACYLLEWSGWYNFDMAHRLLGHYRLYQLYKKDPDHVLRSMPLPKAYILHYRSSHNVKYALSKAMSFIYSICTLGRHYLAVEIETFNHSLIKDHAKILAKFLEDAENDFTQAFHTAMTQLRELFFDTLPDNHNHIFIRLQQEYHHHHTTIPHQPAPVVPTSEPPALPGKTKGVFSKKQMLILFDLLSQVTHLEKLNLSKPNKYDAIADLLFAITGKKQSSWTQELNDYKNKDLYEFHTEGERNQLIAILTNLAERFRMAGLRSIAAMADKKIRELEHR
ncbi:MAG TPA: hypothetical protein VHC96_21970 [Puia sp.]|jgi:hypothetical protein|nr:hypothetical protein [Puia sp.]